VWDDLSYIQYNPDIHTINILKLFKENSFNHLGQYRALTATYFAFLYTFFGGNTFFYHLIQLGLHITNAAILLLLFKKFFSIRTAFFLSLIFLIHPMQVESVSFIGASGNILLFLLGIVGLFLLHKERYRQKQTKIALVFFLFLLSLLAKETGIVFLVLALVSAFLFLWKNKLSFLIYGVGTIAIYMLIRFKIGGSHLDYGVFQTIIPIANLSFGERVLNMPAIFFYYIKTFIFPFRLVIDQQWVISAVDVWQFYIPLLVSLAFLSSCIGFGVVLFRKKSSFFQSYIFFFLWFLLGIGIHMQLVPLDSTVADRWFYVPIAGLLGMIGVGVSVVSKKKYTKPAVIVATAIVVLLSLRTVVRNANWIDYLTLLQHDTPLIDNYEMENNLAALYSLQRKYKEAIVHEKKSVALYPNDTNLSNLAFFYENVKDYEKTEEYYKKTITTTNRSQNYDNKSKFAYLHLGGMKFDDGKPEIAVQIYKEGLKKYPHDGLLWSFLAAAQYQLNQQQEALASAQKAKTYLPTDSTHKLYDIILNKKKLDIHSL
jgi:hypothetical protein